MRLPFTVDGWSWTLPGRGDRLRRGRIDSRLRELPVQLRQPAEKRVHLRDRRRHFGTQLAQLATLVLGGQRRRALDPAGRVPHPEAEVLPERLEVEVGGAEIDPDAELLLERVERLVRRIERRADGGGHSRGILDGGLDLAQLPIRPAQRGLGVLHLVAEDLELLERVEAGLAVRSEEHTSE